MVTSGNSYWSNSERTVTHFPLWRDWRIDGQERDHAQGVITVSPAETAAHVMNLMTRHRVRHMPVLRDGKLAGIISIGDVVKHRLDDLELETKVLRDVYIAGR